MTYRRPGESLVIEGLLTTVSVAAPGGPGAPDALASRANVAPMGPVTDQACSRFVLRPFKSSTTYRNLVATGQAVFHVTDDVLIMARAAMRQVTVGADMPFRPAQNVQGVVLTGACRYYELRVQEVDEHDERAVITAAVVGSERLKDFLGFNRARHAVLEAAILVTRLHLTDPATILHEMERLQTLVDKTGSDRERQAMAELREYVRAKENR